MRLSLWIALWIASCLALPTGPARAEGPADWGYELADELMSPFCPGRALSECPSPNAEALRTWILEQEKAGVSRADVESQLYERWGDELRQTPRPEGVGLVAYLIPALLFVLGGGLIAVFLGRQRSGAAELPEEPAPRLSPVPSSDPDLESLMDAELRGRDES